MKKLIMAFGSALMLISCAGVPGTSQALENANILILGEDADTDTVPRNSRVFKRTLDAMADELNNQGFRIFDETAVTMDMAQGRSRRADHELIDIAKSISRPPIDIGVLFQIYGSAKDKSYKTNLKIRVSGRLLNIRTGQRYGNFEYESPREWYAPKNCQRDCLLEAVGKYSKILGAEVASVLGEKLREAVGDRGAGENAGQPDSYSLIFSGFSPNQILDIEEYLVVFTGYKEHRPGYTGNRRAEFWYTTHSKHSRLLRNIRKMFSHLGMKAHVSASGNEIKISRI